MLYQAVKYDKEMLFQSTLFLIIKLHYKKQLFYKFIVDARASKLFGNLISPELEIKIFVVLNLDYLQQILGFPYKRNCIRTKIFGLNQKQFLINEFAKPVSRVTVHCANDKTSPGRSKQFELFAPQKRDRNRPFYYFFPILFSSFLIHIQGKNFLLEKYSP